MNGMGSGTRSRTRTTVALAAGALVLAGGLAAGSTSYAAGDPAATDPAPEQATAPRATTEPRGYFDSRRATGDRAQAAELRSSTKASSRPVARTFRRSLADDALLEYDGSTGTVRVLENLDGYLTGPSTKSAAGVAMGYVRAHHDALGLTTGDLDTFHLRRDYRDVAGIHHLSWTQRIGGDTVFGNGLQAAVTRDGRLLMLGGSPVSKAAASRRGRVPADHEPRRGHLRRPR